MDWCNGHVVILTVLAFGIANGQTQLPGLPPANSAQPNSAAVAQATPLATAAFAQQQASNTGPLPTAVPQTNGLPLTMLPSTAANTMLQVLQTSPSTPLPTKLATLLPTDAMTSPTGPLRPPTALMTSPSTTSPAAAAPPPIHIQIAFVNSYNSTAGLMNGVNVSTYIDALTPNIANVCNVPTGRITDVNVTSQPDTGFLIVRFTIQPPAQSASCVNQLDPASCGVPLQKAFDNIKGPVNDGTLVVQDYYRNNLTVAVINYNPQFTAWTDDGPCPVSPCQRGVAVCDCALTGSLYCRDLTSSSSSSAGSRLLYLLLLLLLIPIAIIAVLIVLFIRRKRRSRQQPLKKVNLRADMLTYKEYTTRQHHQQQPKVATISSRYNDDNLFRSLGENVSIAFNSTTFVDPHDDRSSGASIIAKSDDSE